MSTELFTADEMPFNLISETIAAPVKILSPREEEAARAATVRAGGYEHTPSMFDAPSSYEVKINRVRECPGVICSQSENALDYWNRSIATADWFSGERENLVVLILNTKLEVFAHAIVSIGTLNETMCHPREVFRPAIALNAHAIYIMHNHPSGDSTPSAADYKVTRRIKEAAHILGITLIDHLVIGDSAGGRFPVFSFADAGVIQN
jgi:DNA repair protein RadC